MAGGWARDGAVQDQIDASVADAVNSARAKLPSGDSLECCEECGENIPMARRLAMPGVHHCIACQSAFEKKAASSTMNRRGSKDSQLK